MTKIDDSRSSNSTMSSTGLGDLNPDDTEPDDLEPDDTGPDDTGPDPEQRSTRPALPCPRTPHPGRPGQHGVGRSRYGTTSRGHTISIPELLRLAGEAEIYPVVCTTSGQVLDLGRTRRIASKTQTMALISRDGGCSFPGCDIAPEWCERHHVIGWEHNGPTDLDNLTLLCAFHHRQFLQRGWQVSIDNGIPQWIPPRWLDPKQRPRFNHRITARIHQRTLLSDHDS